MHLNHRLTLPGTSTIRKPFRIPQRFIQWRESSNESRSAVPVTARESSRRYSSNVLRSPLSNEAPIGFSDGVFDDDNHDYIHRGCSNAVETLEELKIRSRTERGPARSAVLLDAIERSGRGPLYDVGVPGKHDLSYTNARDAGFLHAPNVSRTFYSSSRTFPKTLQDVIGRYILSGGEEISDFDAVILSQRGFTSYDVQIWETILLGKAEAAGKILTSGRSVPSFLYTFYLRRSNVPGSMVDELLSFFWKALSGSQPNLQHVRAQLLNGVDHHVLMVRLIRHACRTSVANLARTRTLFLDLCAIIMGKRPSASQLPSQGSLVSEFSMNRFLTLFSRPMNNSPFLAASAQEKLQFDIIKFMGEQRPTIAVTQEGYQALVRVQLAMRKTQQERRWAVLKAKSWPPWKEDKTGMDAHVTVKHGISRAEQVMRWSQQAGYKAQRWMRPAKVLAGWDTDRSPTVQTRTFDRWVTKSRSTHAVWAARIASTRTLVEAWAGYLAYRRTGGKVHQLVCQAMFEKLFLAQTRTIRSELARREDGILPGDGPVVFAESTSPYEQTYVERMPPTIDAFLEELLDSDMVLDGDLLNLLLKDAPSVEFGVKVLEGMNQNDRRWLRDHVFGSTEVSGSKTKHAPRGRINAYLNLVCKAYHSSTVAWNAVTLRAGHDADLPSMDQSQRLGMIVDALLKFKNSSRAGWTTFLQQLLSQQRATKERRSEGAGTDFTTTRAIVDYMQKNGIRLGGATLELVCRSAAWAATETRSKRSSYSDSIYIRNNIATYLRHQFQYTVQQVNEDAAVPAGLTPNDPTSLLYIPKPSVCHAYVRALGLLDDLEGLHSFAIFLQKHSQEFVGMSRELAGRQRTLRQVLVALRTFLEKRWVLDGSESLHPRRAEVVNLVQDIVNAESTWGGWPSDGEVAMYCEGSGIQSDWNKHDDWTRWTEISDYESKASTSNV